LRQALQYFPAIALQVEFHRLTEPAVQNLCKLYQGLKINFRPLGPHSVERFIRVLLPGAIETSEEVLSELLARAFGRSATALRGL
jgi:hypothetical protein